MKSKLAIFIALILLFGTTMTTFKPVQAESSLPSFAMKAPMPTARGQAAIITGDDGLIYAIGGFNNSLGIDAFEVVEAYNPSTNTWTTKEPLPVATRGAAVAKGLDGIIYVFGGYNSGYVNAVQAYNTTSNTWTLKTSLPSAVWMAGAATGNDGRIYVAGGEGAMSALQIYDPEADTWTTGSSLPSPRRLHGVAKGPDGYIYVIGGYDGSSVSSEVFFYVPTTDTWSSPPFMPMITPRLSFGFTLGPNGKFYIIGGGTSPWNNQPPMFNRVDSYDIHVYLAWEFEGLIPTSLKELGAATAPNGKIYIIGGANGTDYVDSNIEMTVLENQPPMAFIDSITPNPAVEGESVSFVGHGLDSDGNIAAYKWRSSIDGVVGSAASFDTSTLSVGTHTIYFSVKDKSGTWSEEVTATVTVNVPYTEDPTYQKATELEETVSDLEQQNSDLSSKVDALNATIDDLNKKLDLMTLELLGAGIVTLILVIVAIALIYMTKSKKTPAQATL